MKRFSIAYLLSIAARIFRRFTTRHVVGPARREPVVTTTPPQAIPTPEPPQPAAIAYHFDLPVNRAERRRLERARRRKDKFVTPGGVPLPEQPAKPKREPTPKPVVEVLLPAEIPNTVHDAELLIADGHHTDETRVLFREGEMYGEFYFRDTILDQLDRYFVYLRRMRSKSPDDYAFYRQVGAVILPYGACNQHFKSERDRARQRELKRNEVPTLPLWFNLHRPAFGCFVYGADPHTEQIELEETAADTDGFTIFYPKFMSITKYAKPPLDIEPAHDGDVYKMSMWWDRPHDPKYRRKWASQQDYCVYISADGKQMRVLRQKAFKMVPIYSKRKHEWFSIPHREFCIPSHYERMAVINDYDNVQKFLLSVFCEAVQHLEEAGYAMVRVTATRPAGRDRAAESAVFAVNVKRMGYFFQDRDVELTEDGVRKRIFHIVRAHVRKDGTAVPFHFRGVRQFEWAGYHIDITVPVRDHADVLDFDAGAIDADRAEKNRRYLTEAQAGKMISETIKKGAQHDHRHGPS